MKSCPTSTGRLRRTRDANSSRTALAVAGREAQIRPAEEPTLAARRVRMHRSSAAPVAEETDGREAPGERVEEVVRMGETAQEAVKELLDRGVAEWLVERHRSKVGRPWAERSVVASTLEEDD